MKYLKEYKNYTTTEEDAINDLLDKGIDNLSDEEMEILKNEGKPSDAKYVGIPGKLEFEHTDTEDYGDELRIIGNLYYDNSEYQGYFILPTTEENMGHNSWRFFKDFNIEFEPDEDDLYELDSMIQEIEYNNID